MLSGDSPIGLIYLRKVMKPSSSNGCLSLQYRITLAMLRGYPKSGILCIISESSIFVSTVIQEGVLQMMNMMKMCVIEEGGRTCLYAEDVLMLGSRYAFIEVEGGM